MQTASEANRPNAPLAFRLAKVIENLTKPDYVRPIVAEIYGDRSGAKRDELVQNLAQEFGDLKEAMQNGKKEGKDVHFFLDDPPTAVYVTACQKAGITHAQVDKYVADACDDGRLWINATALGADAQSYQQGPSPVR